jgi:acetoin:2,6-dichlorophenolindophenol oxidoreductase subunit alpha
MQISNQVKISLFYHMLRIRRVQEKIESRYLSDEMKTPIHLCIGQEAVAAGICMALEQRDYITSNHRGHGHYLAKGGNLNRLIAELHCKEDGCSKGYGGSMHLIDRSVGHLGSSSIVGGGIPIGTGIGLSISMKEKNAVSVIFFGDGAADEGVLYESINFAMLKKLPVIYVLENNHWSVCSPVTSRQATDNIFHTAPQELLMTRKIDGNDILSVYESACLAVERAKNRKGPSFIECVTYRILGHAGSASQDAAGYRDPNEVDAWKNRCPIKQFQEILIHEKVIHADDIMAMEKKIQEEIDSAFLWTHLSRTASETELEKHLFCE